MLKVIIACSCLFVLSHANSVDTEYLASEKNGKLRALLHEADSNLSPKGRKLAKQYIALTEDFANRGSIHAVCGMIGSTSFPRESNNKHFEDKEKSLKWYVTAVEKNITCEEWQFDEVKSAKEKLGFYIEYLDETFSQKELKVYPSYSKAKALLKQ